MDIRKERYLTLFKLKHSRIKAYSLFTAHLAVFCVAVSL